MSTENNTPTEGDDGRTDAEILEKAAEMDAFPEAEDYDPDANYDAFIVGASPKIDSAETWDEFGLAKVPIQLNGEDTGRRLLLRNGKFLADVSADYKVLPHERLAVIADEIARELGAVPFSDFGGDWYINLDDHIIMDEDGRRFHALYAWDDPVTITDDDGNPDTIQLGFAVHNSIDASLGFNVGLFTFRHACQNMVWMGVNGEGMDFDDREVVAHHSHKHTSGLSVTPESLRRTIEETLFCADSVTEAYREWTETFVTVDHVEDMIERLPSKDLPDWVSKYETDKAEGEKDLMDHLEAAAENEALTGEDGDLTDDARERVIRSNLPQDTVWETYNDLTESVWHDDGSGDRTKQRKMKQIHEVFPVTDDDDPVTIR